MRIKEWLSTGELSPDIKDTDEIIENAGYMMDHACTSEILGEVAYIGEDNKTYVVTIEAVIGEANPKYVKNLKERLKEEVE